MSNVAIFKSGEAPKYLRSVHTPDYENDPDVIVNPAITEQFLQSVPFKHWKRNGDDVVEMNSAEKQAVDDAKLLLRKNAADDFGINDMKTVLTALIKVINLRLGNGKKITKVEMITALKEEIT